MRGLPPICRSPRARAVLQRKSMGVHHQFLACLVRNRFPLGLLILLPLFAVGCTKSGVGKVVPVSGKVTFNGVPLTGGNVSCMPEESVGTGTPPKYTPSGLIKEDGSYELTTDTKKGAPPGKYRVAVNTSFPGAQGNPVPIPPRYTNAASSDLRVEVSDNPK